MLNCHGRTAGARADDPSPDACLWFDLLDPTEEERRRVEQATGLALPSRERIGSVELSSRVVVDGDVLRLNVPHFTHEDKLPVTPVGLILAPAHLVSLRYTASPAFDHVAGQVDAATFAPASSVNVFVTLIETIVGAAADRLENIAADVGTFSAHLFDPRRRRTDALRAMLEEVGCAESHLARARLTATGVLRISMFARDSELQWIGNNDRARLASAHRDLEVLGELDAQLTDKLQFLLDAALGFISIEQNDVMKVFTVAAVAAIPPVILVGVWGMNFRHMPELGWRYGYPMALAAIVLSIVVPVLWFKRRDWF